MTAAVVDRLTAECGHLRDIADPELDALRRGILVEDVLGVRLRDDQFRTEILTDPDALRAMLPSSERR